MATSTPMAPRVGLVLGAGGIVGQAYHAGVLAALEHDWGWDPRTADVIVGTSAGSVTGTLLRLGIPAHDLAAWAVQAPLSIESGRYRGLLERPRATFPPMTINHWLRQWRTPPPALLRTIARKPWAMSPRVIATAMMPAGEIDLLQHAEGLVEFAPDRWPPGLWIVAACRDDGSRVVFGRTGSPSAGLDEAVAASCAIPGYFSPVLVDGIEYLDGGVHSPSNADVLRSRGLDLVIAVSPMSVAGGVARTVDAPIRYAVHRRLERELGRLVREGVDVVRIEPGRGCLAAMGVNMMADDRSDRVVQEAFIEAGGYAASDRIAARLAPLRQRSRPRQRLPA